MRVKRLIVTADDFGISPGVNEAIENAHRGGILSAASLMVAGDSAADAVDRARRLPSLGVGLHLVLVDGRPLLPARQLPDLVDAAGFFPNAMASHGARLFFSAAARRQAAAEIRAQLEAFRATGLPLDHVNAHHHFHFHPVVRDILIGLAPEYGIRAIRVPREPAMLTWHACGDHAASRLSNKAMLGWFTARLKGGLDRARIAHNDWQLGLSDTGEMNSARLAKLIVHLPDGVTELYSHPSMRNAEYTALIDPSIAALLARQGVTPIPFAAL
jgi:hopanoid biosynthesis associated protein HpnK